MASGKDTHSAYFSSGRNDARSPPSPPQDESKIPSTAMKRKKEQESFSRFLFNPDEMTVLGRTGLSWAKIGLFYVVFYLFLAGYFAFMMTVFYTTLDSEADGRPKYTATTGSIIRQPGLSIRPTTDLSIPRPFISFDPSERYSYGRYVHSLEVFAEPYKSNQGNKGRFNCTDGRRPLSGTCNFDFSLLGSCSSDKSWGYDRAEPCVLLKMNKVFDWIPEPFNSNYHLEFMPAGLRTHIQNMESQGKDTSYAWVWCEADYPDLKMNYFPEPGFQTVYFPYENQPGYLSPIVALKLSNLTTNQDVTVKCNLWAMNIIVDPGRRMGSITFVVRMESYQASEEL